MQRTLGDIVPTITGEHSLEQYDWRCGGSSFDFVPGANLLTRSSNLESDIELGIAANH